ncbi:hypothetical protein VDBG_04692 [Verticillium alfalfae VaMs.102]|uniref:Uncharacterized protein n=1 Tax=Verticillium alfalfae (strain VaMs.102 / ATCC MYA-4576 / FGSC 10136) TaxID=526221 RepID=C9SI10_VERA1|nr:hypothetical protein VDBG_04692 [Verticillium alfalfae VaMs.102]EEY18583.1 hypothetical protein VDBG_04692 [Verticillium alfalfae VaMs.102]
MLPPPTLIRAPSKTLTTTTTKTPKTTPRSPLRCISLPETPTRPNPRPAPRHEPNTTQPSQPRDQGRPSKSGFFFNLTKSSKSTQKQSTQQQQPPQQQQQQQQQHQHRRSESRGEIASRGTDTSVPSSKSAKLSGTGNCTRAACDRHGAGPISRPLALASRFALHDAFFARTC